MRRPFFLTLGLILLLSLPVAAQEQPDSLYSAAAREGRVIIGMPASYVLNAWGEPDRISSWACQDRPNCLMLEWGYPDAKLLLVLTAEYAEARVNVIVRLLPTNPPS